MTIWEAMTEDAREYITNNFCGKDSSIDEVIEFFRFDEEFLQSEADSYGCFWYGKFLCKSENGKITNMYYVYDLYNFGVFGKNNEMILAVGCDDAVIINLKTFEVVKKLKLR
jgi:hypothetical protein